MDGFMMANQVYAWVILNFTLDHDGKPVAGLNVTYNDDFCEKGKKL